MGFPTKVQLAKAEQTESFYRDLLARLEMVPGVQRARSPAEYIVRSMA